MYILGFIGDLVAGAFLLIDGVIYDFIRYFYRIFLFLAQLNLFKESEYNEIVNKIYMVLGVAMLFILAYSLLRAIINPDDFSKGETSFPNIIKNLVISLILIAVMPTIFSVSYSIQNSILRSDVIGKIFLSENYTTSEVDNGGNVIASTVFKAFFNIDPNAEDQNPTSESFWFWEKKITYEEAWDQVEIGETFRVFTNFNNVVSDGKINYSMPLSTIAGGYVLYVILLFCFDLGVRVVKLIFYQIISPVAVICRVLPNSKAKEVFNNWTKLTIGTFMEVFIRVFVMYIGVYIIILIWNKFGDILAAGTNSGLTFIQILLVEAFLVMGVIAFMKQAPKLIQDVFGLELGNLNLGLKGLNERLNQGGAFAAAGFIGGGVTSGVRNFAKGKGLGKITSALGGFVGGARRGAWNARNAQNYGEMRKSTIEAISQTEKARDDRDKKGERYKAVGASIGIDRGPLTILNPIIGRGHDVLEGLGSWAGVNNIQDLLDDNKNIDEINSKKKGLRSAAEDLIVGESNKAGVDKAFGITALASTGEAFSTKTLRQKRQEMERAKASGAANAGQLEDEYATYLKEFTDLVQNQALLSSKEFDALSTSERADLSEARSAAVEYRRKLQDSVTESYVAVAGITTQYLAESQSLDVTDGPLKKVGDELKIAKQKNIQRINELRETQAPNSDGN